MDSFAIRSDCVRFFSGSIGPAVARDTADCAAVLEILASHDKKDSTSVPRKDYNFTEALTGEARNEDWIPSDYSGEA